MTELEPAGPIAVGAQVGTPGLGANIQFALNDVVVLPGMVVPIELDETARAAIDAARLAAGWITSTTGTG